MKRNQGQATVEYVLILVLLVVIAALLTGVLEVSIRELWIKLAEKVTAGCPTCLPGS